MEERFTQRLKHNSERVDPWEDSSEKLRYRSEGDDHNRVDDYNRGGAEACVQQGYWGPMGQAVGQLQKLYQAVW